MPDDRRPRLDEIRYGGGEDFSDLWDSTAAALPPAAACRGGAR
jgi:hypothetical protein